MHDALREQRKQRRRVAIERPSGAIDGFSRIWTPQPVLAGQSSSVGSVSQSFEAIDLQDNLAESWGYGLRQDANFRTNVGLVNLYDTSNTFTVNVVGLQGSTTFQTTVQPYSMEQPALPAGVFGDLFIHVTTGASNFNWWSAYGSSVDNATGRPFRLASWSTQSTSPTSWATPRWSS